ncbi:hypothetical protein HZA33_01760 [Candidatus Pacearchaeota archaeon]|nr:hypothetical protein [Candidatus Pacearchaeota archaeon]
MGFWDLILGKKRDDLDEHEVLKKEFKKASEWIKHLHAKDGHHENNISDLNSRLSTIEKDLLEIKNYISFFGHKAFKQPVKQLSTVVDKQTPVGGVQTSVQTGVQEDFLGHLSSMERAIIWILLNTELKLSYEDVSVLLGKDKSTIRGQINSIRQKREGLIEEVIEKTGKKRIYVPEGTKAILLAAIRKTEKKKKGKR